VVRVAQGVLVALVALAVLAVLVVQEALAV
jgi:hypothetical protein